MTTYNKPVILANEEMAEGVYAASGANGDGCYTATARIHQVPETGRGDYRIQVDGKHAASHACDGQMLTLYFNQPVTYSSSNGSYAGGNGTNTLQISYTYWNNGSDNIGLGDVVVTSNAGLAVTGAVITDDGHRK